MDHVTVVPIVSNEDDAIVAPLQPHEISRRRIVLTLEDRDDFAAFEPGGRQPDVIEPGVSLKNTPTSCDPLRTGCDDCTSFTSSASSARRPGQSR